MITMDCNEVFITGKIDGDIDYNEELKELTFRFRSYCKMGTYKWYNHITVKMRGDAANYMAQRLHPGNRYYILGQLSIDNYIATPLMFARHIVQVDERWSKLSADSILAF